MRCVWALWIGLYPRDCHFSVWLTYSYSYPVFCGSSQLESTAVTLHSCAGRLKLYCSTKLVLTTKLVLYS